MSDERDGSSSEAAPSANARRTATFSALGAGTYSRQALIKEIDQAEQTSLICYVCGDKTEIGRDDTLGFVELLQHAGPGEPIDLLLHTCGGDVDACEKLMNVLQENLRGERLRVIIPEAAKSSGTLLALSADEILMGASSELGMIDPQYDMKDSQGNYFYHSVVTYLRTFDYYSGMLSGGARNTLAERMLLDFDAKTVAKFRGVEQRIRNLAEKLIKRKDGIRYTEIARDLLQPEIWRTHGQPIFAEDARDLGLPVTLIASEDPRWHRYLTLHCLQRQEVKRDYKLFESRHVSHLVQPEAE